MAGIENSALQLGTGLAVVDGMFGIFGDNFFQTGRALTHAYLLQGTNGIFGTHVETQQGYWQYPNLPAGPIHQIVSNFTPEQIHIGQIEGGLAALAAVSLLTYAGLRLLQRSRTHRTATRHIPARV